MGFDAETDFLTKVRLSPDSDTSRVMAISCELGHFWVVLSSAIACAFSSMPPPFEVGGGASGPEHVAFQPVPEPGFDAAPRTIGLSVGRRSCRPPASSALPRQARGTEANEHAAQKAESVLDIATDAGAGLRARRGARGARQAPCSPRSPRPRHQDEQAPRGRRPTSAAERSAPARM